jgi:hypothetical protein
MKFGQKIFLLDTSLCRYFSTPYNTSCIVSMRIHKIRPLASFNVKHYQQSILTSEGVNKDRLCGLVVRVTGYRTRGRGLDSRNYQIC